MPQTIHDHRTTPLSWCLLFCAMLACLPLATAAPPEGLSATDWQSIQQQIKTHAYTAEARPDGGFRAHNPVHGLDIEHDPDGTTALRPRTGGDWRWGLITRRIGTDTLDRPTRLVQSAQTVTVHWNDHIREWWINRDTGLEQWFEVGRRPAGLAPDEPLTVAMAIQGNLHGTLAGEAIAFTDDAGATVFTYDRLKVWDTTGRELAARMGVAGRTLTLTVTDAGAVYPLTIDPVVAVPGAYLKARNAEAFDRFATAVAVDGDTVVIGAPFEDGNATGVDGDAANNAAADAGAAYVFVRDDTAWTQQAYLKAANAEAFDEFGIAVAVDGDTVVVGAYTEDGNATSVDGDASNNDADDAGAAYVFARDGTTWTQQAYLKAHNAGADDQFGISVAVDGDTVVVGASLEDGNATGVDGDADNDDARRAGAAYVFVRDADSWTQQAYLKADNAEAGDRFGHSVAVAGDTVVVGAYLEDGDAGNNPADDAGAAYVFVRGATTWTQQAYLKADSTGAGDQFGIAVALDGDTVVVGAPLESSDATTVDGDAANNDTLRAGAAYVFVRGGTTWAQQAYLKAANAGSFDQFGSTVAVSGDTVVVGATGESSNANTVNGDASNDNASKTGAAYVFMRDGTAWTQQSYLKAGNAGAFDEFGSTVAVSGDTVVVGATGESSSATTVDGDAGNDNASKAGAAYVFILPVDDAVSGYRGPIPGPSMAGRPTGPVGPGR